MDTLTAINTRSSATKLAEPGPTRVQLESLLDAASRAPDHGRLSPWRFVIVEGGARERLGAAMAADLRQRLPESSPEELAREHAKALRAPLVIVVASATQQIPKVPEIEQLVAIGAAIENLVLAAHAMGFGTMWRTGKSAYSALVKEALGLAPQQHIIGFIYLGTASARGPVRPPDGARLARWL